LKIEKGVIILNEMVLPPYEQYWRMDFKAPRGASEAKAGQFIMVKAGYMDDPFLRRPMGLNIINKAQGVLGIIYQVVGKGTRLMTQLKEGDEITYSGPWGNGWRIEPGLKKVVIVGGGAGIASLHPLVKDLYKHGCDMDIYLGASNTERLVNHRKMAEYGRVTVATLDGSLGYKGPVDEFLPSMNSASYNYIFTCGPKAMMSKVAKWSEEHNLQCQVCLEQRMGCGIGACMCCVCSCRDKNGAAEYRRVCKEGPIFSSREVDFDA
jgi:dihydroorotate dehydrogenase electron transfer subunit